MAKETSPHWMFHDFIEDAYWEITAKDRRDDPIAEIFANSIATLKNPAKFPDQSINSIIGFFDELVTSKIAPVFVTPRIDDIQLWYEGEDTSNIFKILLPYEFEKQYKTDRIEQEGQLVFYATLAREWFFGKYKGEIDSKSIDTAIYYQGLFFQTAQTAFNETLNPSQQQVADLLLADYSHPLSTSKGVSVTNFPRFTGIS